ncbi:hypothetical protein JCM24511_08473 [Saitozyma sp. JCM 24511]|nr:hypothetical protein JCM24511_08473 [Saitozyma sp. JCM 24511]
MSESPQCPPAENVLSLLHSLRQTPPRLIQSPPTQPRRASVALILRMKPAPGIVFAGHEPEGWTGEVIPHDEWGLGLGLEDFFRLSWVNHPLTTPELLFIRRAGSAPSPGSSGSHARWSSHIAFPGGRHEPSDESALYTAFRETWEEIGVDLAEREFVQVGRLDEREITTSLGKRLLMILSPFVFLQTTPFSPTPELQASEVSSVHWIPLASLTPPFSPQEWSHIEIDISTRLSPRNRFIRWALRGLVGKMEFGCVLLPDEPDHVAEGFDAEMEFEEPAEGGGGSWINKADGKRMLRLWGLSLGMTLDLLAHLPSATPAPLILSTTGTRSKSSSPERSHAYAPRTPVTVTSSFDDQWDAARKALEASSASVASPVAALSPINEKASKKEIGSNGSHGNGNGNGHGNGNGNRNGNGTPVSEVGRSGAGVTSSGRLGAKVDVKGLKGRRRRGVGPGVTAVFPRFSYPDVNFWIWVFGRRYRQVVKGWEASVRGPDRASDRRTNWSGAALATFYSAVRQALVVAIILRALATGLGLGGLLWWGYRKWAGDAAGRVEL